MARITRLTLRCRRTLCVTALLWFGMLLMAGCATATLAPRELTPLTVQLRWIHDAQFAGFYIAEQRGYYAEEGLAVTFREGGTRINPINVVLAGEADFGINAAEILILARADEKPVRAVATIYRRNPLVFLTLADSGITRPQQFAGKKVRLSLGDRTTFYAMMAQVGVTPDQITEVDLPSDPDLFATGEVPVWSGYLTSLAVAIQRAGHEINIIFPDDYGVHFYADTLFTTDEFLASNPDLALRFVRATLKGWTYAIENPNESGEAVAHYDPASDVALSNEKMVASIPLINTGVDPIGWMRPEEWEEMAVTLRGQSILTRTVTVSDVYTLDILSQIYRHND